MKSMNGFSKRDFAVGALVCASVGLLIACGQGDVWEPSATEASAETTAITDHQSTVGTELQTADDPQLQLRIFFRVFLPFPVRINK